MNKFLKLICTIAVLLPVLSFAQNDAEIYPPQGFVYLHEAIPDMVYDIRYAGNHNFIGKAIDGYENPVALLSVEAAEALKNVQKDLQKKGFQLKVFDAYRPQRAVNQFMEWARDHEDTAMKSEFYPNVKKSDLFNQNYIASRSGHTRGSTIDLTLIKSATGKEVYMGSPYDFFGEISHHGAAGLTAEQEKNRAVLKNVMQRHGFRPLATEWWHYSLEDEPYPETYFDFPVK